MPFVRYLLQPLSVGLHGLVEHVAVNNIRWVATRTTLVQFFLAGEISFEGLNVKHRIPSPPTPSLTHIHVAPSFFTKDLIYSLCSYYTAPLSQGPSYLLVSSFVSLSPTFVMSIPQGSCLFWPGNASPKAI